MHCNFCELQRIKSAAKARGLTVTLLPFCGGWDVFIHPPHILVDEEASLEEHPLHRYWGQWYARLTERCSCGNKHDGYDPACDRCSR